MRKGNQSTAARRVRLRIVVNRQSKSTRGTIPGAKSVGPGAGRRSALRDGVHEAVAMSIYLATAVGN